MLLEKIKEDLKSAMRAGDQKKLGVLRMLASALANRKIEKRAKSGTESELTEEEVLEVVSKEAKKRKESIALFVEGDRADLAATEKVELDIITAYLPPEMNEADVKKIIDRIVAGATVKEFGPLMKEVMKELKGKADAMLISRLIKEATAK